MAHKKTTKKRPRRNLRSIEAVCARTVLPPREEQTGLATLNQAIKFLMLSHKTVTERLTPLDDNTPADLPGAFRAGHEWRIPWESLHDFVAKGRRKIAA